MTSSIFGEQNIVENDNVTTSEFKVGYSYPVIF